MPAGSSPADGPALVVVQPPRGWQSLDLGDLWRHRDLLYFMAWRDVKVRYAQAAIGVLWAVLQPLLMMAAFTLFLSRLAKVPSEGLPYPVFALSGLVPWTFFASAATAGTESLVAAANMVTKVYFARLVLPLGAVLSWLPDVLAASAVLVLCTAAYGLLAPSALLLPLPILFTALVAASVGVWLSALNVAYRDVRYAVPFVIQLLLFATPVVYPASLVPARYRALYGLNPMAGGVESFRWVLFGRGDPPWSLLVASAAMTAVLLVTGLSYFRRVEHRFADVI